MKMYGDSGKFSLDPRFDLQYEGSTLMTEEEMALLKLYATGDTRVPARRLNGVDERFRSLVGVRALSGGAERLSAECANAIAIFEIKAELSREQLVHRWKSPSVAADSVVFRDGRVLLIRRRKDPYKGYYALPGGILDENETLEECALRELHEETGLNGTVKGLLSILSDPNRDPRVRMVSAVYVIGDVQGDLKPGDDAAEAAFFDVGGLPHLAFDHDRAIQDFRKSTFFIPRG